MKMYLDNLFNQQVFLSIIIFLKFKLFNLPLWHGNKGLEKIMHLPLALVLYQTNTSLVYTPLVILVSTFIATP